MRRLGSGLFSSLAPAMSDRASPCCVDLFKALVTALPKLLSSEEVATNYIELDMATHQYKLLDALVILLDSGPTHRTAEEKLNLEACQRAAADAGLASILVESLRGSSGGSSGQPKRSHAKPNSHTGAASRNRLAAIASTRGGKVGRTSGIAMYLLGSLCSIHADRAQLAALGAVEVVLELMGCLRRAKEVTPSCKHSCQQLQVRLGC